jgi:hypothetical protein
MYGCLGAAGTFLVLAAVDLTLWRGVAGKEGWLIPLAAALLAASAVGSAAAAWKGGRRWRALHDPGPWKDGALVAARGKLAAEGPLLTAPGSGRQGVLYEYTLRRHRLEASPTSEIRSRRERVAFNGDAMVPVSLETPAGTFRLSGWPSIEPGQKEKLGPEALPRLVRHLLASEIAPPIAVAGAVAAWRVDFPEGIREQRRDRATALALDLPTLLGGENEADRERAVARALEGWKDETPFVSELGLADGEEVVAFGRWDAASGTIEVGGHGVDSARGLVPADIAWGLEGYFKVFRFLGWACGAGAVALHAFVARVVVLAPPR